MADENSEVLPWPSTSVAVATMVSVGFIATIPKLAVMAVWASDASYVSLPRKFRAPVCSLA